MKLDAKRLDEIERDVHFIGPSLAECRALVRELKAWRAADESASRGESYDTSLARAIRRENEGGE